MGWTKIDYGRWSGGEWAMRCDMAVEYFANCDGVLSPVAFLERAGFDATDEQLTKFSESEQWSALKGAIVARRLDLSVAAPPPPSPPETLVTEYWMTEVARRRVDARLAAVTPDRVRAIDAAQFLATEGEDRWRLLSEYAGAAPGAYQPLATAPRPTVSRIREKPLALAARRAYFPSE